MADVGALIDSGLVTPRQVDHWVRKGYLRPAEPLPGSGNARDWSAEEVRVAERMARLVGAGVALKVAADVARADGPVELAPGITLELTEVG